MSWNEEFEDTDDQVDTIACSNCRVEIYDEAEQCPHCGEYVSLATSPFAAKPFWVRCLMVMIIIFLIAAFVLPFCGIF
jgi:hypothetical protein